MRLLFRATKDINLRLQKSVEVDEKRIQDGRDRVNHKHPRLLL